MTDPEKPLHVRVAEVLGWRPWTEADREPDCDAACLWIHPDGSHEDIPRYDKDWSATGPLIEKYGIELECFQGEPRWWAKTHGIPPRYPQRCAPQGGEFPLIAVCNLLLKLEGEL